MAPLRAGAIRCDTNPGGPEELAISINPIGSDIDVGWTADAHNIGVPPGSSIRVCLDNCGQTSDPLCDISGQPGGVTAGAINIAPPLPIYIDNRTTPICALMKFAAPGITGTANIETGDITGSANVQAMLFLGTCPECSGATAGATGTCSGGATPGAACTTDQLTTVTSSTGAVTFKVSEDCLPSGLGVTLQAAITLTTGMASLNQPCPGQSASDDNECGAGTCSATCTGSPASGGVDQLCCDTSTTTACFPATIDRQGFGDPAQPGWPDALYPKQGEAKLVGTFCAPGNPLLPSDVGVPGPAAVIFFSSVEWISDSDGDGLYDQLDQCPDDADCDDDGLVDGARQGSEDLDEDGTVDAGETDPQNFDSDGDGLPDGLEAGLAAPEHPDATDLGAGHFIADADPATTSDPLDSDSDDDGVSDGEEDANHNGRVDAGEGDPNSEPPPPPPDCTTGTDCADDNPCTEDVCSNETCSNPALTGIDGAQCLLTQALGASFCSGVTIDTKLTNAIRKGLTKSQTALGQAESLSGNKRVRRLKKARNALTKLQKKVTKATTRRKNPLPGTCGTEINAAIGAALALIPSA
jgi:hypothetical protein